MSKKYINPTEQITLEDLKSFLWSAATRLRGLIDATGYKEFIFPLLFFKRISDVYDEEYNGYVCEAGAEYAHVQIQESAIQIPDGEHWNDVRQVTENVGQRLVQAFTAIEQANKGKEIDGRIVGGLDGIFGPKDKWTNKAIMPDHVVTSLIEDFSRYNLSLAACPADEMGQAYEYLIGKFADDAGNTAQEFYTNRTVVTLMAEILQPKPNESIYDPTCGSGGMLVKCLDYLRQKGEPWQGVKVFGQEINILTSAIARMNLYLNGVQDFSIACADTLENPAFVDGSQLRKFDVVLANPPYSISQWNREKFMSDKWKRNSWGVPTQARADYAFIQHIIESMDERSGRSATLLPHGVLNREEDKDIRINHVKSDTIDAIIGLGRNLFYNSGLESFIFICSNCKSSQKKEKILFIDAEKCTHKEGKQAYLYEEDIKRIVDAYNSNEDIEGFSKYVTIDEIIRNNGNLNIKSYVKAIHSAEDLDLPNALADLSKCQHSLCKELNKLPFSQAILPECNFSSKSIAEKDSWRRVKLSDIAEEYSVRVENPSQSEYDFYIGSDCIAQYDFRINKRSDASTITSTQKGFKKGDYLLVRRSLYGSDFRERAPRADFDGVCSADILTIREKEGCIADGFLIYVLYQRGLWDFIVSNSNGGLTRRIKWKQLANFEFALPPYKVQKQISTKLWAAYHLKESYKKLLAATEEMVKSQFIEMFKNLPVNGVIKDLTVGNIASVKKSYSKEDIINYIDISSIDNTTKTIVETSEHLVTKAPSRAQQCVQKGDILVSTVRPINRNIAVIEEDTSHLVASTGFCILRPQEGYKEYLLSIVLSDTYTEKMCDKANGGLYPAVNNSDVLNYGIHIPDEDTAKKVSALYQQSDKSKFELRKSIEAIDKVIKSLINN